MPVFVALLRGVNVGGRKPLPMARLRELCADLGLRDAETYVQSGNIVFESAGTPAALEKKLRAALTREQGFDVPTLVKSATELSAALKKNPFLKEKGIDPAHLHVTFLASAPTKAAIANLSRLPPKPDRFALVGREIFLCCPNGYGRTKLTNTAFERLLAVEATTRNWRTFTTLQQWVNRRS